MKNKVSDIDKGYKELLKRLTAAGGKLKVGVLSKDGSKLGADKKTTIYDYAMYNEFGLGVPERSFIRGWADEEQELVLEVMKKLLLSAAGGKITREQMLNQFGMWCVGRIQLRISDRGHGAYPPNAPSTIKKKGSDVPLINDGLLRAAISYAVEK